MKIKLAYTMFKLLETSKTNQYFYGNMTISNDRIFTFIIKYFRFPSVNFADLLYTILMLG